MLFRNSAAGELKPRLCLFARCAPQMRWGCCNSGAGERKGAAWVAGRSGFGLSGQPGIGRGTALSCWSAQGHVLLCSYLSRQC